MFIKPLFWLALGFSGMSVSIRCWVLRFIRLLVVALLLSVVAGCGGGGGPDSAHAQLADLQQEPCPVRFVASRPVIGAGSFPKKRMVIDGHHIRKT